MSGSQTVPMPSSALRRNCRIAALIVFLALPLLHYGALEALYQSVHHDLAYAGLDTFLSYWLQIFGELFPAFGFGVLSFTLCRVGNDRPVIALAYLGTLLPYGCMLVSLSAADPDFSARIGEYLLYLLFPVLQDLLLLTLVLFLCLIFRRHGGRRDPLHTVQWLAAALLLFDVLIPEVVATVQYVQEMLTLYYEPITAFNVFEIVLTYLFHLLIIALGWFFMRIIEWLLQRR